MSEILTCDMIANNVTSTEASIVASLYAQPELYLEYNDIKKEMFKSPIWKTHFIVFEKLAGKGATSMDEITVENFLNQDGNEKLRQKYIEAGGYRKIAMPASVVETDNMPMWVDDLRKHSSLYDYIKMCTLDKMDMIDTFKDFTAEDVYNFISAKVNHVFLNVDSSSGKSAEITSGIRDMVSHCNKGLSVGLPIKSKLLNSQIKGLQLGQLYCIAGLSGSGKTTLMIELVLAAIWEHGESGLIMLNEQDKPKIQQQILTWIINNIIKPKKHFNSGRWMDGHFTEDEMSLINQAINILEEKIGDNKIVIHELQRYSCKTVCKLVRKYASMGFKYFVLDTFKVSSDTKGDNTWFGLMQDAVDLYDLIKPASLNVFMLLTYQLEKGKAAVSRYLSEANLGVSKNVKDVFSVLLMTRRLYNDEYTGERSSVKCINPIQGTSSGMEVTLHKNKNYQIIFIDKNRNGESNTHQIVVQQELGWLYYKELGICEIPFGT